MNTAQDQEVADLAEREMLADLVRDALLTRYPGPVRPVHRVMLARLLREDGAAAILAGIDAVREVAARGESREIALESFVWALMREVPAQESSCLLINWPGWNTSASHAWGEESPDIRGWYGGLVDGMRDASGQMYMRNRYYDPATGQFTQTDPIGLAGGLNAYGFAAGDPVSYSDPYGLKIIIHGSAEYRERVLNGLLYVAGRSETFRTAYNALVNSKDVTIHIGANFLPACGADHCFKRGFGSEGRIRLQLEEDDEETGYVGAHELFHAAGAFSRKVPEARVPPSCGNDRNPSAAHECVNPREQMTRDEVADWKRRSGEKQ